MRGRVFILLLLCACAAEERDAPETAWPVDGFLHHLPQDVSVTLRLPGFDAVRAAPEVYERLLRAFGRGGKPAAAALFGAAEPEGIDPAQGPGLALTGDDGWVLYLAARDKGALNRALQPGLGRLTLREEKRWIILSEGGKGAGDRQGDPLPPGDLAVRVQHHPLLAAIAQPGDTLELGCDVAGAGLRLSGRLVPGPATETAACLADARAGAGGLIELIPSGLGVRVETTLPTTFLAGFLTRRIALHAGVKNESDRVHLERFLREILTGADPETGLGFGIDFRDGEASFVAVGRVADGPASPILAKLRTSDRSTFGALVLDRRDTPAGLFGFEAWLVEPQPRLEGLPETAFPLAAALASGADAERGEGLALAYTEWSGWFVAGGGRRGDLLVRSVRRRLESGGALSAGSWHLRGLVADTEGDYVLGAVVAGAGFGGLAQSDRVALRKLFRAGPGAGIDSIAVAGFRRDAALALEGIVRY